MQKKHIVQHYLFTQRKKEIIFKIDIVHITFNEEKYSRNKKQYHNNITQNGKKTHFILHLLFLVIV